MHPQAKQIMSAFALVAAAVAIGSTAAGARAQGFGYHGPTGPAHWGELSPAWEACRSGQAQSPVDIRSNRVATRLELSYGPTTGEILDNGHTIEVETHGHNTLTLDGTAFELVQFHFHSASEHRVGGRGHDMELHLVHRSAAGALAVIGVFLQRGASSGALGPILARLPERGEHLPLEAAFDPAALLPALKQHFRYAGSLTTPPCSEGVQWLVLRQPMTISDEDAARLAERLRFNARAVQRALR